MKLIKSNQQTLLKETQLSNCLMVKLEGPSIKEFHPDKAIDLWFQKATRPGTSASQENKVEAFQSANSNLATSEEEQAQVPAFRGT